MNIKDMIAKLAGNEAAVDGLVRLAEKRPLTGNEVEVLKTRLTNTPARPEMRGGDNAS